MENVKTQAFRLKSGTHRDREGRIYRPGEIVVTDIPLDQKWPNRFECILVRRRKGQPEVNAVVYDDELSPTDVAKLGDIPVEEDEEDVVDEGEEETPEVTEAPAAPEVPVHLIKKHIKSPRERRGWWVINEATGNPVNDSPLTRAEAIAMERGE